MINFVDSLNKGLELVNQYDANNKEIETVFAELNRQLNKAYDGKLVIELNNYNPPNQFHDECWDIVAKNPISLEYSQETYTLAEWTQCSTGYPCAIFFSGQKCVCEDKESLEQAIAELLSDPVVARDLRTVINQTSTE